MAGKKQGRQCNVSQGALLCLNNVYSSRSTLQQVQPSEFFALSSSVVDEMRMLSHNVREMLFPTCRGQQFTVLYLIPILISFVVKSLVILSYMKITDSDSGILKKIPDIFLISSVTSFFLINISLFNIWFLKCQYFFTNVCSSKN